jgi:hypothetical protein
LAVKSYLLRWVIITKTHADSRAGFEYIDVKLAGSRGFEPPVSGVTGRRVDRYTTTPQLEKIYNRVSNCQLIHTPLTLIVYSITINM